MSEETVAENHEVIENIVQEAPQEAPIEQEPQEKNVPLSALEAERRKRQEAELRAEWYQQQQQQQPEPQDDEDEYTKSLKNYANQVSRQQLQQHLEKDYLRKNPECLSRIQNELKDVLQERPWLAPGIQNAENRYEAAMDLINAYAPRRADDTQKRIEENSKKPSHPQGIGKSSQMSKAEMISNMSSNDFHAYRKQMRGR